MEYTTETRVMPVTAYRDKSGEPTCAADLDTGDVCMFYRTHSLGLEETCFFAAQTGRYSALMKRRNHGMGTLIPLENCPVWAGK